MYIAIRSTSICNILVRILYFSHYDIYTATNFFICVISTTTNITARSSTIFRVSKAEEASIQLLPEESGVHLTGLGAHEGLGLRV